MWHAVLSLPSPATRHGPTTWIGLAWAATGVHDAAYKANPSGTRQNTTMELRPMVMSA